MKLKEAAMNFAGVLVGVAGGAFINKKGTEAVQGLLGEDETPVMDAKAEESAKSTTSKYLVPAATTVAGIIAAACVDNDMVKSLGAGLAAAGAVRVINEANGSTLVSLNGVGRCRGIGELPISSKTISIPRALPQQTPTTYYPSPAPNNAVVGVGVTSYLPGMGNAKKLYPGMGGCLGARV